MAQKPELSEEVLSVATAFFYAQSNKRNEVPADLRAAWAAFPEDQRVAAMGEILDRYSSAKDRFYSGEGAEGFTRDAA